MTVANLKIRPRHSTLVCGYCRGTLYEPIFARRCGDCGVLLHADCFDDLWTCPTLGCEASPLAHRVRLVSSPSISWRPLLKLMKDLALGFAIAVGTLFALVTFVLTVVGSLLVLAA